MERNDSEEYRASLEELVAAWLEMSIRELIQSAKGKNINVTQATINSIMGSFAGLSQNAVGEALIGFQNSGRFLDFRKSPDWQKFPPIESLAQWVLKIGLSKFKYVPGYRNSKTPPTAQMAARRIAWGVAIHRYQLGAKRKRPWFAKLFYKKLLGQFITMMVEQTGTSSIRVITENFNDKTSNDNG
jgi:hypothetical protein